MKTADLITVILPTRNRRHLLERAVGSVLDQNWPAIELIITDDASEDGTARYLEKLEQDVDAVNVIRNREPEGAAASRNRAVGQAAGSYLTGLDDDDYWLPGRLEKMMNSFDEGLAGVCSYDRIETGSKSRVWKKPGKITLNDLLFYNRIGNQLLTRTDYIREVNGFDENLPSAQDYDLWLRLMWRFGPVKCVPEPLQVVNMEQSRDRITTSDKKVEGYRRCFRKHEHMMTEAHKRYQRYRLELAAGNDPGWRELLKSVPVKLYKKEITRKLFL